MLVEHHNSLAPVQVDEESMMNQYDSQNVDMTSVVPFIHLRTNPIAMLFNALEWPDALFATLLLDCV